MNQSLRYSTGIPALDAHLGGGLLPGTLTVVAGATGIGKTQLGIQFGHAGLNQEGRRGIVFDVSARGDSQSHAEYAQRIYDWQMASCHYRSELSLEEFFAPSRQHGEHLNVFDYRGQRVTRRDLDWNEWNEWQAQLNVRLRGALAYLYGNFVQGVRRVVVDGVEPAERPNESIQLNLFEYVYHQVLRKEADWVARDLFRESFRQNREMIENNIYDHQQLACVLLYTSHEMMLDDLIARRLDEGDALSNANTLIYMGKIREGTKVGRGIYIAKHRGSACSEDILPYKIGDGGIELI